MKVAIDLRWMQDQPYGGVGRILAQTLPHLLDKIEVSALLDARRPGLALAVPQYHLRTPPSGRASSWLQWSAPRWLRGYEGVFHCPWYGLPYRLPVPGVATIHDLTFEHHPEWMSRSARAVYRAQARHAGRSAAALLTDSHHVRNDLIATYGVDPARVLVAPPGVDPAFRPTVPRDPRTPDRYVVAVGGAARRNLPRAISAWQAARVGLPLVVVGPPEPVPEGVHHLGRIDDEAWAAVLAGADALMYPTAYEGFGMPALEAAASGTPVVCAPVGSLPEVLGDAASWATDLGVPALAAALRAAVGNDDLRDRGLARVARRPGWEQCAATYLAAYALAADA
jgi:glycosyltransferase involved in cell wall biosynthesis